MGINIHVKGFKIPNERWYEMKAIWDTCVKAKVDIPLQVLHYFGDDEPYESGVQVDIPYTEWSDDYRDGIEIQISDLPSDLTSIRFYNSY